MRNIGRQALILEAASLVPKLHPRSQIQAKTSAANSSLLKELFPNAEILMPPSARSPLSKESISSSSASSRVVRNFALVSINLENGNFEAADTIFHRTWRSQNQEMRALIDVKLVHAFITALLEACISGSSSLKNSELEFRANHWLEIMHSDFGVAPTIQTFAIFLHHHLHTGDRIKAEKVVQAIEAAKMELSKLFLDPHFFESTESTLLQAFLQDIGKVDSLSYSEEDSLLLSAFRDAQLEVEDTDEVDTVFRENEWTPEERQEITELRLAGLKNVRFAGSCGVSILAEKLGKMDDVSKADKYNLQMWIEQRSFAIATEIDAENRKNIPKHLQQVMFPPAILENWAEAVTAEIIRLISIQSEKTSLDEKELMQFLTLVSPDKLAKISIATILEYTPKTRTEDRIVDNLENGTILAVNLVQELGDKVCREYNMQELSKPKNKRLLRWREKLHQLYAGGRFYKLSLREAVARKQKDIDKFVDWKPIWEREVIMRVGGFLAQCFMNVAKVPSIPGEPSKLSNAIEHSRVLLDDRLYGVIKYHQSLLDLKTNPSYTSATPIDLPMVIPPLPWITWSSGGYIHHRSSAVRFAPSTFEHADFIKAADEVDNLTFTQRALDILGSTAWQINHRIFKLASWYWNTGIEAPGKCLKTKDPEPLEPLKINASAEEKTAYRRSKIRHGQGMRDAFSVRCTVNYQLEISRAFLGETIYFPHSIDFRGRAYPMPPHLNHISNDLCRGLLKFKERKPLGENGLRWLKIQVSNLHGNDKVSLDNRVKYTEDHLETVKELVKDPHAHTWWKECDDPWQLLSTCFELCEALECEDPTKFKSNLPIHQDGSCNALQHYAALGGDVIGAREVNLLPSEAPGDLYSGVSNRVREMVKADCEKGIEEAILMRDKVNRKLVKQTVMTNTYGVTYYGAKDQVLNRLRESKGNETIDLLGERQMRRCSVYITTLIFQAMADMFGGAKEIQTWLKTAAQTVASSVGPTLLDRTELDDIEFLEKIGALIQVEEDDTFDPLTQAVVSDKSDEVNNKLEEDNLEPSDAEKDLLEAEISMYRKHTDESIDRKDIKTGETKLRQMTSVTWTSPLGLPIVQPYYKASLKSLKTHIQTFTLRMGRQQEPVNVRKQSSAFPPNFIHSLDASHMMLTAVNCHASNITFASVHDSYWTHPGDVDNMNKILREAFIQLHSQDLIANLSQEFNARFSTHKIPTAITLTAEQSRRWKMYKGVSSTRVLSYRPFYLPPVPKRGDLDITLVRDSKYFFH